MAWLPLPESFGESLGRGVQTGGNIMQGLLQSKAQQAQLAQQQARAAQEWQQHLNELELKKQQEARAQELHQRMAELHPYELQNLISQIAQHQAQTRKAEYDIDPNAKANAAKAMVEAFGGIGGAQGAGQPGGQNLEALGEFIKQQTGGYNPVAETREQKAERELNEHLAKQEAERQASLTKPTPATITANQEIIGAANSVIPLLEALRDGESFPVVSGPSGEKEKYKTRAGLSTDKLMKALKLPGVQKSLDMIEQMTHRGFNESDADFKTKVQFLIDEVEENARLAHEANAGSKVEPIPQHLLKGTTKKGEKVRIDPKNKEKFLEAGGTIP